jgi:hypothetical protein
VSSLAGTDLVYASLALPAVAASAWALYRCSGALVLDALDADEMLAAAVHRLVSVGYTLFALGLAVAIRPDEHDLRSGTTAALTSAWAGLLVVLGLLHLVGLAIFARMRATRRNRDLGPPRWYAGPTSVAGAPPPTFSAPPPFVPPHAFGPPPPFVPPPRFVAGAAFGPPPPPWCTPVPLTFDPWTPPQR